MSNRYEHNIIPRSTQQTAMNSGPWEYVAKNVLAVEATHIGFSSLDLVTDSEYYIKGFVTKGTDTFSSCSLFVNYDSASANYYTTDPALVDVNTAVISGAAIDTSPMYFEIFMQQLAGQYPKAFVRTSMLQTTNQAPKWLQWSHSNSANVTSIQIGNGVGAGASEAVGSKAWLYRMTV